jgi:hypothetical protein
MPPQSDSSALFSGNYLNTNKSNVKLNNKLNHSICNNTCWSLSPWESSCITNLLIKIADRSCVIQFNLIQSTLNIDLWRQLTEGPREANPDATVLISTCFNWKQQGDMQFGQSAPSMKSFRIKPKSIVCWNSETIISNFLKNGWKSNRLTWVTPSSWTVL